MTVWQLFTYRLPQQPSSARVAVWRQLRRIGSMPLGQGVVVVPEVEGLTARLDAVEAKVEAADGVSWRFRLSDLEPAEDDRLREEWNELRRAEYAEVVDECRGTFERQIEFDLFRSNLTAGRVEELEAELDRLRAAARRVAERDHFEAGHDEVDDALQRCEQLLGDFVERVYEADGHDELDGLLDDHPMADGGP